MTSFFRNSLCHLGKGLNQDYARLFFWKESGKDKLNLMI